VLAVLTKYLSVTLLAIVAGVLSVSVAWVLRAGRG
jgi:hypothetical protein